MRAGSDYVRDDAAPRERGGVNVAGWAIGSLLVIAAAALAIVAFLAWAGDGESEGPNVGVTLNDVTDDPSEFAGTTVTVRSTSYSTTTSSS